MLGLGLILATLLVYCLMVILFQSWLDPFIIMVAVPGAIVDGIDHVGWHCGVELDPAGQLRQRHSRRE
jgi:multidrug efflux pump subunit AcrB